MVVEPPRCPAFALARALRQRLVRWRPAQSGLVEPDRHGP